MARMIACNHLQVLRRTVLRAGERYGAFTTSNHGLQSCHLIIRSKHGSGRGSRPRRVEPRSKTSIQKHSNVSSGKSSVLGQDANGNNASEVSHGEHRNAFDSQYFGDVLNRAPTNNTDKAEGGESGKVLSVASTSLQDEHTGNEFDSQYFQGLEGRSIGRVGNRNRAKVNVSSSNQPGRTIKGHFMFNDIDLQFFDDINSSFVFENSSRNQLEKSSEEDFSLFDQQSSESKGFTPTFNASERTKSKKQFIDTDQSEEEMYKQHLLHSKRTKERTYTNQEEQVNRDFKKPFESHERPIDYQNVSSDKFGDHREVHLITSPTINKSILDSLPSDLRGKLLAERQWRDKDQELRVGHHNIKDLESSVVSALKALKKKPPKRAKPRLTLEQKIYGTENRDVPVSNVACSGCGAYLHCRDSSKPGFVPSEKFQELDVAVPLSDAVCQRCWYLIHRHTAINVSVPRDNYSDIVRAIRKNRRALVILMVDLLDFPCSIIKDLKDLLGSGRPIVIVGNKLDILPKDEPKHESRIKQHLLSACTEAGVCTEERVKYIGLISAKTGYGVEDLISKVHSIRPPKGDVYLLGTANVGKSTLFNRLLESDLCKARASRLMGRATISRWPGTTLSLLRFPLLHPTRERLALRAQRLKAEAEESRGGGRAMGAEEEGGGRAFREDDPRLEAYIEGKVGQTFKLESKEEAEEDKDAFVPTKGDPFSLELAAPPTTRDRTKKPSRRDDEPAAPFNPKEFETGEWFYDTPGVLYKEQILTMLSDEELKLVVPKKCIIPRSLILKQGHTFFLGGLGRLDYVEGSRAIFLTAFSSHALPIKVVPTGAADALYREKAGTKYFVVPQGGKERMESFPDLLPIDMTLQGEGRHKSVADILFSSAGWAGVTANQGMEVRLRAYTPGGLGCILRRPSLVPFGFALRGPRRSSSSPFYNVDKKKLLMFVS